MRLREQPTKIYPASGINSNSSADINVSFEKASKESKHAKLPFTFIVEDNDTWIMVRFFFTVVSMYSLIEKYIKERRILKLFIHISSSVFTISHLIINSYLVCALFEEIKLLCFFILISVLIFFLMINIYLAYSNNLEITECVTCAYILLIATYIPPGIVSIISLYNHHYTFSVILIILMIFSIGILGWYFLCWILLFLMFLILQSLELIVRIIICKFNNKKKKNEYLNYDTYYYNSNKTETKICSICLNNFVDKEVICISKCYKDHIFHEQCIVEWLGINPICPMCRAVIMPN